MPTFPKVSFDNLENAFISRTDQEIKQAYWLFKGMSYPFFVKTGSSLAEFALRYHLPVRRIIRKTIFRQFCGGENIGDCTYTIARLGKYGVGSILDYSVEGKEEEKEFEHACSQIEATLKRAEKDSNIPFSVFKVTGLARYKLLEKVSNNEKLSVAEQEEYARVKIRVDRICKAASAIKKRVFIDAEESWIQNAIDSLATEMMQRYNHEYAVVYNTIQLYRHDRLEYLKKSYDDAVKGNYFLGEKLVRGAYMEKERERALQMGYPSPIQPDKTSSDRDYDEALKFCIEHIDRISICAGTHNEESSYLLLSLMEKKGISPSDERIYFSQLLGMSDHISYNLSQAGFRVAKYVPYGPIASVLPYLTRRAQENTSMSGQMGRELALLTAEKKRRNI